MLKIKNLTATAQEQIVLDDINLEVKKNEIHVILGPEKAGKTALMYSLVGLPYIEITDGSIHYKSKKINNQAMHQRSQNGIIGVFSELIEIPNQTNWGLMESVLKYRKVASSIFRKYHVSFRDLYSAKLIRADWRLRHILESHGSPFSRWKFNLRLRPGQKPMDDPII